MNTPSLTWLIVAGVVVIALLAMTAWLWLEKRKQAARLQHRFGVSDFDRRAADISVDHPGVVENYRAAHTIAARDERGQADTEELRQAVVHYRVLFDATLEVRAAGQSSAVGA